MQTEPKLGFLSIHSESAGCVGGYLVTNTWGRPLEFRLTTAVQPNRVQQILYGSTLRPYLYGELIGRTLVEKAGVAADLVVTDSPEALDLRQHIAAPVGWLLNAEASPLPAEIEPERVVRVVGGQLLVHPRFTADAAALQAMLAPLDVADLSEPFGRIRDALAEARKIGATHRAA